MALFDQINNDIKAAMKAREKTKLEALRNIKKVMIEAKTAKGATAELSDSEALKIISKLAKQGTDSAQIYKEQNRNDLYEEEMAQVTIYESYLCHFLFVQIVS
ncbi:MAG: GatB/YqeY domain-containing protein, partial [Prolixibacteraceae bacterium]|nr:GatB/YqeY domain-containing protein [Prolixibacteraceae bacterium]